MPGSAFEERIALGKAIEKHAHGRDLLKTEPLENRL
jgi:hypothetical protein